MSEEVNTYQVAAKAPDAAAPAAVAFVNSVPGVCGLPVQRKLSVGAVDDPLEQEADAVADKVMRMPEQPFIQRSCAACGEEEKVQRKPLAASVTPFIQAKGNNGTGVANDAVASRINASRGNGSSLDSSTRSFMESRFGADFSGVTIHTGSEAVQLSRQLNAQAFTVGSDIYFSEGKYNPGTASGKHLLAHELTHTIQQCGGTAIQRSPGHTWVPPIEDPAAVEEWRSPGGQLFQWQNDALVSKSFPGRAKALRAFLMVVKELELRGHLGSAAEKNVTAMLKTYLEELNRLDDKELAEKITAVFAQYSATIAFPAWMQDVVMNYSGMKYESAHGSHYDPVSLLAIAREDELATAGADEKAAMTAEAAAMVQSGTGMDVLKAKDKKSLAASIENSRLSTLVKKIPAKEKAAFEEVVKKEAELWQLFLDLHTKSMGTPDFAAVQADILAKEDEIAAMKGQFGKETWRKIQSRLTARKDGLLALSKAVAMRKIRLLSEGQALQLLTIMHDAGEIPEEAWKEIVGHTELRLQVSSVDDMVSSKRALKGVERDAAIPEAAWNQWKYFLQLWYKKGDSTGWRSDHKETLSANLVVTLVCDQLGTVIQNLRGVPHPGGLRKNAEAYYKAALAAGGTGPAAADIKTAMPQGPAEPYFKKPAALSDFPVGASIFWTKWSDVNVTPEYLKVYKEEERQKGVIKRNEQNKKDILEKKKKSRGDDAKLLKYNTAIAEATKKLDDLKKQQESMLIFTPEKDKTPDNSNIVRPMDGSLSPVTKGKKITECMTDDGWTYSVNSNRTVGSNKMGSIMRAKPNSFYRSTPLKCPDELMEGQDKTIVKQWLSWQHEATVMFVIPETDTVVTFDTSFKLGVGDDAENVDALGTRKRRLKDLLEEENLYTGYMQQK